ncbi:tyrosine-type recombinase/integrase [Gryllotalpicola reticulitermitis]|uniref:Tyrosine-type recombinase/integrase n=1 Tax=Gryllotalpicola reticulitermitis TaxID=1184153 RepID=A0ABV8QB50_9MICO
MSRPRLPIGTFGEITFVDDGSGTVRARARFRDWDGTARLVQASGHSERAAERTLKEKLAARTVYLPGTTDLTADSSFKELADYWLADMELNPELAEGTKQLYRWNMTHLVLPHFANLTLREIGVARCDQFIKQQRRVSYNRAKQSRNVLRQAFGLAVRHEVLPRNPMESVARISRPRPDPTALTAAEVNAVRTAIRVWEAGPRVSGPITDGWLGAIVEIMLGTSARIGEVLAIRRRDIDVTSPIPSIRIAGTIVAPHSAGSRPHRQDHPKTAKSRRTIALPSFTAEAVRGRLAMMADRSDDALLFTTRNGTPFSTANVRRQLRRVLELAGIEGVSPHMFRRTAATAINDHAGVDLAADLLGHVDPRITVQHYIRRDEMVDPATAEILDRAFAKQDGE